MFDLEIASQDIFKTHYTFTESKSLIDPKLSQETLPLPPKNLLDHPNMTETRNFIVSQLFTSLSSFGPDFTTTLQILIKQQNWRNDFLA